jgi:hypothetical protein
MINITRPHFHRNDQLYFVLACAILFCTLIIIYSLSPGLAPSVAASLSDIGYAKCLNNSGHTFTCSNSGYPFGNPSPFGLPVHILIAALAHLPGVTIIGALRLAYSALLGIAFLGCIGFLRTLFSSNWIALFGTVLFLASPIVVMEDGYGPLRIGFALLPTYVYINILAIKAFSQAKAGALEAAMWWMATVAAHTFAMFCDGYSFIMELILCGMLWAIWLISTLRSQHLSKAAIGAAAALLSVVIPVFLYKIYIPSAHYVPMPLAFFRGQGIDLFMFLVPSASNWVAASTGLHHHITGQQVFSDGPSSSLVYLGYSFLACGVIATWLLARRKIAGRGVIIAIFSAGLIALLLSLGPSLKWHDFRPAAKATISFDSYLMPAGSGVVELGTGWIYEHVPGVKVMRALYRWQLLARLALIVAAMAVLQKLLSDGRRLIACALALALVVETVPTLPSLFVSGRTSNRMLDLIAQQPGEDLEHSLAPGSRVVFLQMHAGASQNQYLASYLCAKADLTCYNVGGDKAIELSSDAWPTPIFELISNLQTDSNSEEVFAEHLVDAIVIPFFDLRMQAYSGPPKNFPRDQVIASVERQYRDYDITLTKWYAVVRAKPTGKQVQLNRFDNMPYGRVATVTGWGPRSLSAPIEKKTYLWVKTTDADEAVSLIIGSHRLPTLRSSKSLLAAPIRNSADKGLLESSRSYPVYLVDRNKGIKQRLGEIDIQSHGSAN